MSLKNINPNIKIKSQEINPIGDKNYITSNNNLEITKKLM